MPKAKAAYTVVALKPFRYVGFDGVSHDVKRGDQVPAAELGGSVRLSQLLRTHYVYDPSNPESTGLPPHLVAKLDAQWAQHGPPAPGEQDDVDETLREQRRQAMNDQLERSAHGVGIVALGAARRQGAP